MIMSVPMFALIFIPCVVLLIIGFCFEQDLIEFEYQVKLKIAKKIEDLTRKKLKMNSFENRKKNQKSEKITIKTSVLLYQLMISVLKP